MTLTEQREHLSAYKLIHHKSGFSPRGSVWSMLRLYVGLGPSPVALFIALHNFSQICCSFVVMFNVNYPIQPYQFSVIFRVFSDKTITIF